MRKGQHFIAGTWQDGAGTALEVTNPATGAVIATINEATAAELDAAVQAAATAFPAWAATPARVRADLLVKVAQLVRANVDGLATTMTSEQGKPKDEAVGEVGKLADMCDFYAAEATRIHGEVVPNEDPTIVSEVLLEPLGVVAAITPWNYPVELLGWKLCAALAAGCTVVLKPASLSPLVAMGVFRLLAEAGVPAGVANLVLGTGKLGARLAAHPTVAKVAFTGSSAVGVAIQRNLTNIKRLSLELGGNGPLVVTANADLDLAVKGAVYRSFRNMGQICISINRIYVHAAVGDEFLERLRVAAEALVIDDGLVNPAADLGPMASAAGLAKAEEHVADARAKGGRIVCGGTRPEGKRYARGYFYLPTIIAEATPAMQVMSEETFGPLVGVATYTDPEEAVALANDTEYGLASYCYTRDLAEARYFARKLEYGSVAINNINPSMMTAPYGGRKQSGIGCEHAREGMLEYLAFKHVRINHGQLGA